MPIENLRLRDQLRVDRFGLRALILMLGLTGFGAGLALVVRAGLGAAPWDVLHIAVAERTGLTFGTVIILTSILVLLAWIPLRQRVGIGTIANALWVGVSADATLAVVPEAEGLGWGILVLIAGVVLNAVSAAIYIGAQLGPGPRDGLMTGINRRCGLPIGPVRIGLEVTVLAVGWLLGGPIGIAALVYALALGPIIQLTLPYVTIPLRDPAPGTGPSSQVPAPEGT